MRLPQVDEIYRSKIYGDNVRVIVGKVESSEMEAYVVDKNYPKFSAYIKNFSINSFLEYYELIN